MKKLILGLRNFCSASVASSADFAALVAFVAVGSLLGNVVGFSVLGLILGLIFYIRVATIIGRYKNLKCDIDGREILKSIKDFYQPVFSNITEIKDEFSNLVICIVAGILVSMAVVAVTGVAWDTGTTIHNVIGGTLGGVWVWFVVLTIDNIGNNYLQATSKYLESESAGIIKRVWHKVVKSHVYSVIPMIAIIMVMLSIIACFLTSSWVLVPLVTFALWLGLFSAITIILVIIDVASGKMNPNRLVQKIDKFFNSTAEDVDIDKKEG